MNSLDDVFPHVGAMGPYQWLMLILLVMLSVLGVDAVAVTFFAAYMDHWCKVDELANVPFEQQKYIAIPTDDEEVYSNCEYFDLDYASYTMDDFRNWNRTTMITENTTTRSCQAWVYDQVQFVSSSVSKYDLVCSKQDLVPLISTLFMAGIFVGSFASGPLADRIGRRPTLVIFVAMKLASGFIEAFAPNFVVFAIFRTVIGCGTYCAYIVGYVLIVELVGPAYRVMVSTAFSFAYSAGIFLITAVSYSIRDDTWFQFAYLVPYAALLLLWWVVPESPRWLLVQGKFSEARAVLEKMAAVNRKSLPEDFDMTKFKEQLEEEDDTSSASCADLYRSRILRKHVLIVTLGWFTVNLIYYALTFNIGALSGDIFVNTAISGAVEIPAQLVCIPLCNWSVTGRRLTCAISMLLAGVSCFVRIAFILEGLDDVDTAFSFVARSFISIAFTGVYIYAAELFPTEIRNTAISHAVIFAQISGMVSPYVGGPLSRVWEPLPVLVFGFFAVLSGCTLLLLPETLGKPLPETIKEWDRSSSTDATDELTAGTGSNKEEQCDVEGTPHGEKQGTLYAGVENTAYSHSPEDLAIPTATRL